MGFETPEPTVYPIFLL
jgi:hypothetical protein